ncbi:MAG: TonB-dependent receptor [Niabella sp.]
MKRLLFVLLLGAVCHFTWAQNIFPLKGSVKDKQNNPLEGVTVAIKGTSIAATSDADGNFSISVEKGKILEFSYVGMKTTEVTVSNANDIHIILEGESQMDEVVVIGYGTIKQRDVTGSVAKVSAKDLNVSVASNFLQSLQGKAAGVQVIQSTGQPGAGVSVQIRSNPSFANAGVLYVIDGIPVNDNAGQPGIGGAIGDKYGGGGVDKSPLNFINPNDIESIQFLKDASASAIYGARAGAGVVLITTKKGASARPKIQYSGSYGTQKVDKMLPVYSAREYMEQRNQLALEKWHKDNKIAPYYGTVDASTVTPFAPIYTQDQINKALTGKSATDAITRGGYTEQHNISLTGGNGKTSYFASGNYFDQKGVIIGTDYRRYNARLNLDQAISDKIKVGTNIVISNSVANNTVTGGENENGGIVTAAIYWAPIQPLQLEDGSYPLSPYYPAIPNPLSYATVTDETRANRMLTSAYGEWTIIEGLKAKANFSYDQSSSKRSSYFPRTFLYGFNSNGSASITESDARSKLYEYTLTYNKDLSEKHRLNALAGYSFQQTDWSGFSAGNQNFLSDIIFYYSLQSGQADRPSVSSNRSQQTWASYFARAIYTYNNNITLQASIRRDGSSVFAQNKKWGYFPAVSAGWTLSDEEWLKSISAISFLKLRVGYGETGNSSFSSSAFERYGTSLSPYFGSGNMNSGVVLTRAANPNLTWETAGEFNAGLDFGFLRNRITGSFDYFNKTIRDLIAFVPYPSGFIIDGVFDNAGKTRSSGYEIGLNTKNIQSPGGFSWSTSINFSHYLNYWVERSEMARKSLKPYEHVTGRKAVFNPVYGVLSDGIFTGQYGTAPAWMPDLLPGGLIIKDIHGYDADGNLIAADGMLSEADITYLGNADPKFNFGFGNTFQYKGFDLNIYMSGLKQKKWSPLAGMRATETSMDNNKGFNGMPVSNRWGINNVNGTFPTALYDANYSAFHNGSDYWLVDGSFLRARNITLGYTLPGSLISRQNIFSSVRVSFDAQNLFTITSYPGLDPELNTGNFYPLVKSYVFGINVTF